MSENVQQLPKPEQQRDAQELARKNNKKERKQVWNLHRKTKHLSGTRETCQ